EVEHRTAAVELLGEVVEVEHVDLAPVDVVAVRRVGIENPHVVAGSDEGIDDARADEARAPGDRDRLVRSLAHDSTSRSAVTTWSRCAVVITADTGRQT